MMRSLQIKGLLASGGIARLMLAELPNGEKVVMRQLHLRHLYKPRTFKRFVSGIKVREALSPHPYIIGLFENGYSACRPYELIEYIDGKSLRELVTARDPVLQTHLMTIIGKSARALAYVHERGYAHLDVKPANFMFALRDGDIQIKLTDFDLTQPLGARKDKDRAGTTQYMAPEQLRHGSIGLGADIFAFGVTAYILATGRRPFEGVSPSEAKKQQISSQIKAKEPRAWNPVLSPKLNMLIMKCLEKDPEKRIPCMGYLCNELGVKS